MWESIALRFYRNGVARSVLLVIVAQLVRAPVCGTGGRGFNSPRSPQSNHDAFSDLVI